MAKQKLFAERITVIRDTVFQGDDVQQGKIIDVTQQNQGDARLLVNLKRAKVYEKGDEKIAKARAERDAAGKEDSGDDKK